MTVAICLSLTCRLPSSLLLSTVTFQSPPVAVLVRQKKLKLHSLAYCHACIVPGLGVLLRYRVEVMPGPPFCSLQLLLQLLRLLLSLAGSLACVPQGALHLANALLQLPVPPLRCSQAFLHLSASLLLLEQCSLHRGAHQLERGTVGQWVNIHKELFSLQENQTPVVRLSAGCTVWEHWWWDFPSSVSEKMTKTFFFFLWSPQCHYFSLACFFCTAKPNTLEGRDSGEINWSSWPLSVPLIHTSSLLPVIKYEKTMYAVYVHLWNINVSPPWTSKASPTMQGSCTLMFQGPCFSMSLLGQSWHRPAGLTGVSALVITVGNASVFMYMCTLSGENL